MLDQVSRLLGVALRGAAELEGASATEVLSWADKALGGRLVVASSMQDALVVEEQDARHGPRLHDRDPDLCCFLRKITPLSTILGLYDGWVTGLRRGQTAHREVAAPVEWDERRQIVKVNPIVSWTDDDVAEYVAERQILVNLLRMDGYASIGCAPCTSRTLQGEDPRAGRWSGSGKNECDIHLS